MNSKLSMAIAFVAGVAAGSLAMWKISDIKYKRLEAQVDEELASMKEYYTGRKQTEEEEKTEEETSEPEFDDEDYDEYHRIVNESGYSNNMKGTVAPIDAPYVISPEEAGEGGYELRSLTFYSDGILVDDEDDDVIKDIDDLVGTDSLNHFGEYAHDVVYVRNEETKTDYEIIRIATRYNEQ